MRRLAIFAVTVAACGPPKEPASPAPRPLESHFPLATADDATLCTSLAESQHVTTGDGESRRRKVIISDLHLGPGDAQGNRFDGLEDFYAHDELARLLVRLAKRPTELIIAGDFIDFWQVEEALGLLPKRKGDGPVLATDQRGSLAGLDVVLAAHARVFEELAVFLAAGDHRLVIIVGNHDGDLAWPRVQLAIAKALGQRDLSRLTFAPRAYRDSGVHVAHGHLLDAANRAGSAVLDEQGRCRLAASWGQVFVAKFLGDLEKQFPFVDNLYPESSALLWGVSGEPDVTEPLIAGYRFLDMLLSEQSGALNLDALRAAVLAFFGKPDAPSKKGESGWAAVWDSTPGSDVFWSALTLLATDAEFAPLRDSLVAAAAAMPDIDTASSVLAQADLSLLSALKERVTRDPMAVAAAEIIAANADVSVVVLAHTHVPGGSVTAIEGGHYANSGAWTPIGEIAALKKRGIRWPDLSLAKPDQFPRRLPAIVIDYQDSSPRPPHIVYAK